jgi:hypothetical protein
MKLSEIHDLLPNGFHDAEVLQFGWNFVKGTAFFDVSFWISSLEGQDSEQRRKGRIELHQILFISFDPPSLRQSDPKPYRSSGGSLQIDGFLADETNFPGFNSHKKEISPDTEIFTFYVSNWNSFIRIAAADANLVWIES